MGISALPRFYLNTIRNINHLEPLILHSTGNAYTSSIYQKAKLTNKAAVEELVEQGDVITGKDIITALIDNNFNAARTLYEVGCSKQFDYTYTLDAFTIFALFSENFYQAAEFLYELVDLTEKQIDLTWFIEQPDFEEFLKETPEISFFLYRIGKLDNNTLFNYVSIIDLLKKGKNLEVEFLISLNYPANKIKNDDLKKLFEEEDFALLETLCKNFEIKEIGNLPIPYDKILSLIDRGRFDDAKLLIDLGATVENSMIWNYFIAGNIEAVEFLAPYTEVYPTTIATIAIRGHYDLAEQLISQGGWSRNEMEQSFLKVNSGVSPIAGYIFESNREITEKLYKLGAPIDDKMISLQANCGRIEDAKFLMMLKGFTTEKQDSFIPKNNEQKIELLRFEQGDHEPSKICESCVQENEIIDLANFNHLKVNLADHNIAATKIIKSVTYYEKSLNEGKVELAIDNLTKSTLFKPILIYYALMCLDQKNPIYFYDISSEYGTRMKGFSGFAYFNGRIEIKTHPISQEGAEEITYNLFELIDERKDIDPSQLMDKAEKIITSHPEMKDASNPKVTVNKFIQSGLLNHDSGILFHEITHQVMNEVFKIHGSFNSYLIENYDSQKEYHQAICQTLTNIQTKFLPHHQVNPNSCQNLWEFGRELRTKLFGEEINDSHSEDGIIDFEQIMHGIGYFNKSMLGHYTLLSAFDARLYIADDLYNEFIPRLPELEFCYGTKDAIDHSIDGRKHYCKHILPLILDAISSHSLANKIDFDSLEDFGCAQIL